MQVNYSFLLDGGMNMQNMNQIGNKYDIIMFQWYEILVKVEKRLEESIECNKRFGDNEDWIIKDTEKVNKTKEDVEQIKQRLESMNVHVDHERLYNLAKSEIYKTK